MEKIYGNHWAGRDDMKDYICVSGNGMYLTRHVPTGLEMARSRHLKISAQSGHSAFDFGKKLLKPEWEVTLLVLYKHTGGGAVTSQLQRERNLSFGEALDLQRLIYGDELTVRAATPVPPESQIPWSPEVVQIAMQMVLIMSDNSNFTSGSAPLPDRVIFAPEELPKHFHSELKNFVPEPVT
jgi:hypothetical protein